MAVLFEIYFIHIETRYFKKDFIHLFFERKGEGERKRGRETLMCERYIDWLSLARPQLGTWPTTQACALTGNQTSDLLLRRPVLNPLSHTSQGLDILKLKFGCLTIHFFGRNIWTSYSLNGVFEVKKLKLELLLGLFLAPLKNIKVYILPGIR